jgi:hypothetical protein
MTKKPKTPIEQLRDYLSDRKYRLETMHEDDVEGIEEQKGMPYVSLSIEIITEILRKIEELWNPPNTKKLMKSPKR